MKSSVVLAAISAGFVAAELLPKPDNFPACGTTCFGNMLGQAAQLGCGGGGSTADAVDGTCLCKNLDFSYGIIDCSNAVCPDGVASTVVQYGVDWCAAQGVVINGLSATPSSEIASSPTVTVYAASTSSEGASSSDTASGSATGSGSDSATTTATIVVSTGTNSDGSPFTTTLSGSQTETSGTSGTVTAVVTAISTTEIIATLTNSDGSVVTSTVSTSTIFSTSLASGSSGATSGSTTGSGSASESTTLVTETTNSAGETTSATVTVPVSSTNGADATSTESDGGAFQTAAPVGLLAAAGLAALLL